MRAITVLLVDDDPVVRWGLRMRMGLKRNIRVVGEAGDAEEALQLLKETKPDVVVMDLVMPGLDGISATKEVRHIAPGTSVVLLSMYGDATTRAKAQAAGASAFVSKADGDAALMDALLAACPEH